MAPFITIVSCLLLGFSALAQSDTFRDPRDKQAYGIKAVGNLIWMTQNLRHDQEGSVCFNNDSKKCSQFGKLYTFESARKGCPPEWRLATDKDWKDLEIALGLPKAELNYNNYSKERGTVIGKRLKTGGDSGLEIKISGFAFFQDGQWRFDGINGNKPRSYFWTATTENKKGETLVYRRRIEQRSDSIFRFSNPITGFAIYVRCVKDKFNSFLRE